MKPESLLTNFDKSQRSLFLKAIKVFAKTNPDIKVWIEQAAFDSNGRRINDYRSLHTDGDIKESMKFHRFFKKINKRKLMSGEIK